MMIDNKEALRLKDQLDFLGYEFLTWVFLFLDNDDAKHELLAILKAFFPKTEVSLFLGAFMTTCLLHHKEQKTSVRSPILEDSHEAFASIKNGHQVESLALCISFGEMSVLFTLHAKDFSLTQVKLKNNFDTLALKQEEALSEDEHHREEIFLRMAAIDDVEKVIDALYSHFLMLKSKPEAMARTIEVMRRQIEQRLGHYLRLDRALKEEVRASA